MTGVLPWMVRWAYRAGTRDFWSTLAALVGPVQNIFFPLVHNFNFSVPIVQQARPAVRQGKQSLYGCLWSNPTFFLQDFIANCSLQNKLNKLLYIVAPLVFIRLNYRLSVKEPLIFTGPPPPHSVRYILAILVLVHNSSPFFIS
jgi:hypothetical protein